jgi:DNA integrity scanning protein DisA with diadenylate cyclase activity
MVISKQLRKVLDQTNIDDIAIPLNIFDALNEIKKSNKVGLSLCIGYNSSMSPHIYSMDIDIYNNMSYNVFDIDLIDHIKKSSNLDGAILIDNKGNLKHSGKYYRHDPGDTLIKMNGSYNSQKMLWENYGFNLPVCTRHLSAINGSFHMPKTIIFVLSEEYQDIRSFYKGNILYSPYSSEINI